MKFADLGLAEPILRAVASEGYETPTPIQAQSIPVIVEGRDLLGCAQTGTGKTAAFALPILHRLWSDRPAPGAGRKIRALILSPTRELAAQIEESFCAYGKNTPLRTTVIYGGVGQYPQVNALRKGVDILVATPGRLLDLMNQGHVDLRAVEVFVLDEADRMLDLGFFPDIRKVVARLNAERQTMLFSATMPDDIRELANSILQDPVNVQVTPVASTAELIEQGVYFVSRRNKTILLQHLIKTLEISRALVFTRTKRAADKVTKQLQLAGIRAGAIHGDKSQSARERSLDGFRSGKLPVLVATDIAARGIDVDAITHVFNYDVPNVAETYVHRIGRTGRAGATGIALSFCDHDERGDWRYIERLTRKKIAERKDHPTYPKSSEAHASEVASSAALVEEGFGEGVGSDSTGDDAVRKPAHSGGRRPSHQAGRGKPRYGKPSYGKPAYGKKSGNGKFRRDKTPHARTQRSEGSTVSNGEGHAVASQAVGTANGSSENRTSGQRTFRPHEQNRGGSGNRSRARRRNRGRPAGSSNH